MKIFRCQVCGQVVYFENTQCTACGAALGFLPDRLIMSSLEASQDGRWRALAAPAQEQLYRNCQNASPQAVCNWMVPAENAATLCEACRFNQTIPDLSVAGNAELWRRLEVGKRRLVYSLARLGLPLVSKQQDPENGLAFAFVADADPACATKIEAMTGHAGGLITINIAEADDAARDRTRQVMSEPYRTVLGHFRHESGHYYWASLARRPGWLTEFRELFGDERQDYAAAMRRNYQQGPPPDWQTRFVSAYAASHPWEDWAETWAHYLHITDVLETAWAFQLRVAANPGSEAQMTSEPDFDPYRAVSLAQLTDQWLPLSYAVNSLNRSMGQPDFYPFVLAPAALSKLDFVHRAIRQLAATEQPDAAPPA